MKILLSLFFIVFCCRAFAQAPSIEWQKALGGSDYDDARSIVETSDGGSITVGSTDSWLSGDVGNTNGSSDYWLTKLDANGTLMWQKSFGGSSAETAHSVRQTYDGGFVVLGESASNDGNVTDNHGLLDLWILKLDSVGNLEWQKSLGGSGYDYGWCVQQATDGGYIMVGQSNSNGGDVTGNHGGYDYWVVKLSASGSLLWQKCLGGTGDDYGRSIGQTTDGGYIVAGFSNSNNGNVSGNHGVFDYWVAKLDGEGNLIWQKSLGGSSSDVANSVQQTSDGGYVVSGESYSTNGNVSGNHGVRDLWVVKLDGTGNLVWQKSLGGSGTEYIGCVVQTNAGGYVIAGYTDSNDFDVSGNHGAYDYWVVKLSPTGDLVWQKTLGGSSDDLGLSLCQTNDGGYLIAGTANSNNGDVSGNHGGGDRWIVKLGSDEASPLAITLILTDTVACSANPCTADLDLTVSGGTSPYTFAWSNGATTPDLVNVCGGTYHVTVTDASGTTISDSKVVSVTTTCLAPTALVISNTTTNASTVSWTGNACAVKYRVQLQNLYTGTGYIYYTNAPTTTYNFTGLQPATDYLAKLRSLCNASGSNASAFRSTVYFTTSGTAPSCAAPANLSSVALSNTSVKVAWTPVAGSTGYQLRYRKAGTTGWTYTAVSYGATNNKTLTGLSPNTAYQVQLSSKCSLSPVVNSAYSSTYAFATPLRQDEDGSVQNATTQTEITNVQLYPNPSNGTVHFNLNNALGTLAIYDLGGKLLRQTSVRSQDNETVLSDLPNGVLLYRFNDDNGTVASGKFVVIRE